ncbi:MAG: LysR family transcriptional regulator, partial [Candidatus Thiodiazotropha sp. (ex Gloverina cf. vestifex)]|nr:LysR family transcriptional regulator [Candidatus Thiodiazotropha sp. (ex Gloverina cf. vestifex)]
MDLQHLRSLLAVSETGSITEAADHIGITQPALSRRLQQLEAFLGAELLNRGRKGAELTEIGRLVVAEAQILVNRFDHLKEQVRAHQGLEGGTVRIGGSATAVSFVLSKAIASFQRSHPAVRFQLKEAGSIEVAEDVISGRLELGLVTLPVQARELDVWPLLNDSIVLVGPKGHPLANKKAINAKALDGLAFVGFEADTAVRQIINAALREAGVEMNVVMELRSIPAILRMVATTGNLAFVSRLGVDSFEEVREIEVNNLNIERELQACRYLVKDFGTSESPKSTRQRDSRYAPT